MARFDNKVVMITGGASGIGAACARRFASDGARVAVLDQHEGPAKAMLEELQLEPETGIALACDVSDRNQVEAAFASAINHLGDLDVLVNSAGISGRHVPEGADFEQAWQQIMDINVRGSLLASHAAVAHMKDHGGGAIVNLASIMGSVVHPPGLGLSDGFNAYAQSKGAVIQMTKDLAVQFAAHQIRANAVCPGFVETPLTAGITGNNNLLSALVSKHPVGRLGSADEIANVITFLASDEASFVTGAAWLVDGGYTAI